ncbi:MAG: T9SS type A sorting domain-containing protein, partial [Bacteroidales bacterium]|nr:T9SS type A sorting domain-containing protein [Bacteroidales bacterium]
TGGSVAVIGGANLMSAANSIVDELNYALLMTDSIKYIGNICTMPTRFNHKIVLGDPMLSFNYKKDTTSYIEEIEVSSNKIVVPYCSNTIEELYIKISETDQSDELDLGVFDPLDVNYSGEVVLFDSVTVVNGKVEYLLTNPISEQIHNLDILLYSFTEEGYVSFHKSGNASSYTLSPSHTKLNVYYKYPKMIIEGNENECIESVQLFSSNGTTLYQGKINQQVPLSVNMAGLGQGIYLVKITTSNNQVAVNKLIVY